MSPELLEWATRHHVSHEALRDLMNLHNPPVASAPGASEAAIQAQLRVAAARNGVRLWRNNSGAVTDDTGRLVRYGLGNDSERLNRFFKSSDLIGITPVQHAGRVFGVFTAVECKAPGWKGPKNERERAQSEFLSVVAGCGGIARFATSVEDMQWPAK